MANGNQAFDPNAAYQSAAPVATSQPAQAAAFDPNESYQPAQPKDDQSNWVTMRDSGGAIHSFHPDDVDEAQRRDPGLMPTTVPFTSPGEQRYQAQDADKGLVAAGKRNTVGVITGIYHALADPATDQEKSDLLEKVHKLNARSQSPKDQVPESFATNPSRSTLAYHRLLDAPADVLAEKGHDEIETAKDLLENHEYWKGGSAYLSGLADKAMSAVPVIGPIVSKAATRAGQGDPGALVDIAGMVAAENAPEIAGATGKVAGKVASKIPGISDIRPEWLTKAPEVPAPNHGTPLTVESPLDRAAVSKTGASGNIAGKDLSAEAVSTLQGHVGDKIPVGSTAKNMLVKAVEPVTKTIADTAAQMDGVVRNSPGFKTSVMDDGQVQKTFDDIKDGLPESDKEKLSKDVDGVLEDVDDALRSKDPVQILEQRRLLGRKIDWDQIENNPSTPKEVQNLARAKAYRLLGEKIRTEIPATAPLDKILQPNIELRSHMKSKLGEIVEDPAGATIEHRTELAKGQKMLQNKAHNEKVEQNLATVKRIVMGGTGAAGVLGEEAVRRSLK